MKTVSMNAAVSIIFAVILVKCQYSTAQMEYEPDIDTRLPYTIAIGKQAEARIRDGHPVTLDCHALAEASFGCDYNHSSIMWFQSESIIRDNSTIRGISISSDKQRLLISALSIASGAEDGTEAVYTCKVCGRAWGESGSLPDCKKFKTQVKAKSPPKLECGNPSPPDISGGFVNLPFGCDLCLEDGQSVFLVTLECQPTTNRQPTTCTIRNPDGIAAQELDDADTFSLTGNALAVSNEAFRNPENPAPPTVLGTWTCTCINSDGMSTAVTRIGSCNGSEPHEVIIGQKDEVKIPEGESVILDVHPLAAASFENDYNRSSIMWFRFASMIEDNSTIRGISISSDRQRLLISTLFIASGAEDGTEAVYRCKVCGNGHPDNSSLECKEFKSHLRALSPPKLECGDPTPPDISGGFVNLPFGCDLCLERDQSVFLVTLECQPITNRQPTNCTIRNPDGVTADELDDGDTFSLMGNTLAVSNEEFKNPENPAPPTVLGDWSCTCTNSDGTVTATSYVGPCVPKLVTKTVTADFGISITAPKGSIVTLKCTTNDSPNEEFELSRKFGGTIHSSVQVGDKELTINGLSKKNRGTYCCKVSNGKGKTKACSKVSVVR